MDNLILTRLNHFIILVIPGSVVLIPIFPLCKSLHVSNSESPQSTFSIRSDIASIISRDILCEIMLQVFINIEYTLFDIKFALKLAHICIRLGIYSPDYM